MILLILSKDPNDAHELVKNLELNKPLILDETNINEGSTVRKESIDYRQVTVTRAAALATSYKFSNDLVIILDMRCWDAVEKIPHDLSVLIYDGSMKRNLFYNISYSTDFAIQNTNDLSEIKSELNKALM